MNNAHALFRNLFACTITSAFTLFAANAAYAPFEAPGQTHRYTVSRNRFMAYDPQLGWISRPNTSGRFTENGVDVEIRNNSQGMRYHEITPKTRFRVAVLGDSIVQGYSIAEGERFTDILETNLQVDVLNYGIVAYGLVQTIMDLNRVIQSQPDLVIYTFTLYNDFSDNVHNQNGDIFRPYAELDGEGQIKITGQPVPDYTQSTIHREPWLARYPLFRLFYYTLQDRTPALFAFLFGALQPVPPFLGNTDFKMEMLQNHEQNSAVTQALTINKLLLQELRDRLAAAGIPLVIFAAPTGPDFVATPMPDEAAPLRYLRQQARELNLPLVTLHDFIPTQANTFPDDIHWRPVVHVMAADSLAPLIMQYKQSAAAKQQGAEPE